MGEGHVGRSTLLMDASARVAAVRAQLDEDGPMAAGSTGQRRA